MQLTTPILQLWEVELEAVPACSRPASRAAAMAAPE
jgi:hypothetical protein